MVGIKASLFLHQSVCLPRSPQPHSQPQRGRAQAVLPDGGKRHAGLRAGLQIPLCVPLLPTASTFQATATSQKCQFLQDKLGGWRLRTPRQGWRHRSSHSPPRRQQQICGGRRQGAGAGHREGFLIPYPGAMLQGVLSPPTCAGFTCKTSSLPPRSQRRGRPAPLGGGPPSPPAACSSPLGPASPGPAASAGASGPAPAGVEEGGELRPGTLREFDCLPRHQGQSEGPGPTVAGEGSAVPGPSPSAPVPPDAGGRARDADRLCSGSVGSAWRGRRGRWEISPAARA